MIPVSLNINYMITLYDRLQQSAQTRASFQEPLVPCHRLSPWQKHLQRQHILINHLPLLSEIIEQEDDHCVKVKGRFHKDAPLCGASRLPTTVSSHIDPAPHLVFISFRCFSQRGRRRFSVLLHSAWPS